MKDNEIWLLRAVFIFTHHGQRYVPDEHDTLECLATLADLTERGILRKRGDGYVVAKEYMKLGEECYHIVRADQKAE